MLVIFNPKIGNRLKEGFISIFRIRVLMLLRRLLNISGRIEQPIRDMHFALKIANPPPFLLNTLPLLIKFPPITKTRFISLGLPIQN